MRTLFISLIVIIAFVACDDESSANNANNANNTNNVNNTSNTNNANNANNTNAPFTCDALSKMDCVAIHLGESVRYRVISDYETTSITHNDESITVVAWADLIDAEVTGSPENYRYQVWGTDGYTFGGYATWINMQAAYIEVGTRLTVFDPSQELPESYNVKDSYKITLSPAK